MSRLNLKQQLILRAARKSPAAFRRELVLPVDPPQRLGTLIEDWQEADFAALDDSWKQLASLKSSAQYQRAWLERPRGHSKTSDMAAQIAWILLFAPFAVQGLAAAADREQAALIGQAVQQIARCNPLLCEPLKFRQHLIVNAETESRLDIISSDVQSSWGALPDFVVCDELCHWEKPELWYSLLSSAAKKPNCVLTVLSNAGVGRGWQWDVRESARESSDWYFSSIAGPQAPWIKPAHLEEQKQLLPAAVYARLWENQWQHSDGEFLSLEEAEACCDETLTIQHRGQPRHSYIAAIDYAEKHDYTVGVILHWEDNRLIVDRMDVVKPYPDEPVKISWVEEWMQQSAEQFQRITFVVDEYQLLGTIQKFESQYPIHRFEFLAGKGNHALAVNLRKLIIHQQVAWYSGCGQLHDVSDRDDLETELASLILKQQQSGRVRIDHLNDKQHHDDRAFALGAACLFAVERAPGNEWLTLTEPTTDGEFGW